MFHKKIVCPKSCPPPIGVYSNAIKVKGNEFLFISGQVGWNSNHEPVSADIKEQTRQAIQYVKDTVEEAGGSLDDIVNVIFYLVDMRHLKPVHDVRAEFWDKNPPASTLVEVSKLAGEGLLVEVSAIAVLKSSKKQQRKK